MRKYFLFVSVILLFLPIQMHAQAQIQNQEKDVDYPWVPRISAYEAYVKYKEGKAIVLHAGGMAYNKRHIMGSFNVDFKDRNEILNRFPRRGMEIFTYCY